MTQTTTTHSLDFQSLAAKNRERLQSKNDLDRLLEADLVTSRVSPQVLGLMGVLERGLIMSEAIVRLHSILDDSTMGRVMGLMNSPLGFKTDRQPPKSAPYEMPVVRRCVVQALLMGLQIVGNEFNIIAEQTYCTREGFTRLLREYPGLTDLKIDPDVPVVANGQAIVNVKASWKLNGEPAEMAARIPVRVNERMGDDAILGKADRKIKCRIYNRLTGSELSDADVSDGPVATAPTQVPTPGLAAEQNNQGPIVTTRAQGLAAKLMAEKLEAQAPKPSDTSTTDIDELSGSGVPDAGRGARKR